MSYHRWVALSAATFLLLMLALAVMIGPLPTEFTILVALGLVLAAACWVLEKKLVDAFEKLDNWSLLLSSLELTGWIVFGAVTCGTLLL